MGNCTCLKTLCLLLSSELKKPLLLKTTDRRFLNLDLFMIEKTTDEKVETKLVKLELLVNDLSTEVDMVGVDLLSNKLIVLLKIERKEVGGKTSIYCNLKS